MGGHWLSSWQIAICDGMSILSWRPRIQGIGLRDTVIALVSSDVEMTLQAAPVVLQKDSYGRTLAVLLADSYM